MGDDVLSQEATHFQGQVYGVWEFAFVMVVHDAGHPCNLVSVAPILSCRATFSGLNKTWSRGAKTAGEKASKTKESKKAFRPVQRHIPLAILKS